MLHELSDVRQIPDEGFRRWFSDDYFDLIVWYAEQPAPGQAGEPIGFQLCYAKDTTERALTWRRSGSITHQGVDDGEQPGHAKMAPVLAAGGVLDAEALRRRFSAASSELDPAVQSLVDGVLRSLE